MSSVAWECKPNQPSPPNLLFGVSSQQQKPRLRQSSTAASQSRDSWRPTPKAACSSARHATGLCTRGSVCKGLFSCCPRQPVSLSLVLHISAHTAFHRGPPFHSEEDHTDMVTATDIDFHRRQLLLDSLSFPKGQAALKVPTFSHLVSLVTSSILRLSQAIQRDPVRTAKVISATQEPQESQELKAGTGDRDQGCFI